MKSSLRSAAIAAIVLTMGAVTGQAYGQTGGTRVAVVDIPYIFKNHIRFQQAVEGIKKDIDAYKDFMMQEQTKMRTEAERVSQFRPGTQEYKDGEEKLARMKIELQLGAAKRQKAFMEREAKEYYNTYKEIEDVVNRFANHNKIGLVLRYSAEEMEPSKRESIMQGINQLVVYQHELNITKYVLDELNGGTPMATKPDARGTPPPLPKR